MPKQDNKMRVGVTVWGSEAADYVDPLERWQVIDLDPQEGSSYDPLVDALKLWGVMNEAGVHAVVFELPSHNDISRDYTLLGFALARAYHVIVITDDEEHNPFFSLPWVTVVANRKEALKALRELHEFREKILALEAKELAEGITPGVGDASVP